MGEHSATTLATAFTATAAVNPDAVALRTTGDGVTFTWRQYAERVRSIAAGLYAIGVRRGDRVALMMVNRPEFHLVDVAALQLGACPFSVYNTLTADQISYVFGNAGNTVVVCDSAFVKTVLAAGGDVEHVISVDGEAEGAITLAELEAKGDAAFDLAAQIAEVSPDDLATIIYTSGTTGPPKGAELTHENIVAIATAAKELFVMSPGDRAVSYLPSAHIADRVTAHYFGVMFGCVVTSVADPRKIVEAMPDVRPKVLMGVPRIWQKLKVGIDAALEAEPKEAKRKIANWAIATGMKTAELKLANKSVPPLLNLKHGIADKLVLSKLRHKLGLDTLEIGVTGAAPIAAETLAYFWGLGIPVYEVWGLSETGGLGTANRPGEIKLGTIGKVSPGCELRLAEDGELLLRGPSITRGYRHDPEKTAEAIDADGWFHTGDIGQIDTEGFVTIVDRKKEIIINSAGKNMSPSNIETALKAASSLIGQAVTIGDNRPYNTALIMLDPDVGIGLAEKLGLPDASAGTLAANESVRELVITAVRDGNTRLAKVEQVKRFYIANSYWEPGGDELTPTLKLRRKPIAEKYAHEIDDLYAKAPSEAVIDLK
jgi:long-subunit acyl-CoA synthetase (AMP-forming)